MKIGRIKFAVKEIAIFEDNIMEIDEGQHTSRKGHQANI